MGLFGSLLLIALAGCGGSPNAPGTYSASGLVASADGVTALSDVTINFSGDYTGYTKTDYDGRWFKEGLKGTVTVTPFKTGCSFDKPSQTVTRTTVNLNFRVTGFTDDFSNPESGWGKGTLDHVVYGYKDGFYTIKAQDINYWAAMACPLWIPTNYTAQVKVKTSNDPANNSGSYSYGMIFNFTSYDLFYAVLLDPLQKQYGIVKIDTTPTGT